MRITDENWQLLATSRAHKQELLEKARAAGVRVADKLTGMWDDEDLFLGNFGPTLGIGSLPKRHTEDRQTTLIGEFEFNGMVEEFAAAKTAVPCS